MILQIPLKNNIPNYNFNVNVNNQNLNFEFMTVRDYLFVNVYLNSTPIIYGARAVHASYLNQYLTPLNGYLFFYSTDALDPTYERLGIESFLYYTDYDALAIDYLNWRQANLAYLQSTIGV